jgi:hypothetical protein
VAVLVISVLATYISIHYDLGYNVDLTLLSIAIIFPLVFNIRGAFKRREKALEHLSQFRTSLVTILHYIEMSGNLPPEDKSRLELAIHHISDGAINFLKNGGTDTAKVDEGFKELHDTILELNEFIPGKIKDRIFRFMNNMQEAFENVYAINSHRTPQALKAYCLVFIYIFPIIYAPNIVYNIGVEDVWWIEYSVVVITEFILISLYNIQDQMEYPFDEYGLDDIKLDNFKLER